MKKIKKILVFMCVLTCVFALTACGNSKAKKASFDYTESDLVSAVTTNTETVAEWEDKTIDDAMEQYDDSDESEAALKKGLEQFKAARKEAGEFVGFYLDKDENPKYTLTEDTDSVTIKLKAQFKKRDVNITYTFGMIDKNLSITSMTYEPKYTIGETMKKAALNTVMGMGTVIIVLVFLSLLIGLFKYVGKAEKAIADKKNSKKDTAVDNTVEQITTKEEIETTNDEELVAVITAAIATSSQTSGDGFVVRSIKRVQNRNWK